jgi:O-antigen ligase
MKSKLLNNYVIYKKNSNNVIFICLAFITLFFSFTTYDPFNSPKQWVLMIFAAWFVGSLIVSRQSNSQIKIDKEFLRTNALIACFLIPQLISALVSDDIITGLIGDVQRRNGFITYLSLSIIFVYVIKFYNSANDGKFIYFILMLTIILATYGFTQSIDRDFASWNNPYNPVILTLGNPNFAAALLGILGTLLFSFLFHKKFHVSTKIFILIVFIFTTFVIHESNSRQGLVNLFASVGIFVGITIYIKTNKKIGISYFILFIFFGALSILGMLQKGPLTEYFYKDSVSIRGYYWRAAWRMFQDEPILGVGTDQYGTYFKLYREFGYPLKYGFDITSSNAHNVFLQFFSTSGFFTGIAYVAITLLIFVKSIKKIRDEDKLVDLHFIGVFSAWIAFQLQSLISIDNIALSIWGWVLGGILLNKSHQTTKDLLVHRDFKSLQVLISAIVLLPTIFLVSRLMVSETSTLRMISYAKLDKTEQNKQILFNSAQIVTAQSIADGLYKQIAAEKMFLFGYTSEAKFVIQGLMQDHPENISYRMSHAIMNENLQLANAIVEDRKVVLKLDPWNAENAFRLALTYKGLGQMNEMLQLKNYILSFVSEGELKERVLKELVEK